MNSPLKKNLVVHPKEEQLALCPLTPRTTGINYEGLGGDVENRSFNTSGWDASSKLCKVHQGGPLTRSRSLQATSWGYRVAIQCEIFVLEKVILLSSNWASACKNQTEGESVQNMGSFTDTVVKGPKLHQLISWHLVDRFQRWKKEKFSKSPEIHHGVGHGKHKDPVETISRHVSERKRKLFLEKK